MLSCVNKVKRNGIAFWADLWSWDQTVPYSGTAQCSLISHENFIPALLDLFIEYVELVAKFELVSSPPIFKSESPTGSQIPRRWRQRHFGGRFSCACAVFFAAVSLFQYVIRKDCFHWRLWVRCASPLLGQYTASTVYGIEEEDTAQSIPQWVLRSTGADKEI